MARTIAVKPHEGDDFEHARESKKSDHPQDVGEAVAADLLASLCIRRLAVLGGGPPSNQLFEDSMCQQTA